MGAMLIPSKQASGVLTVDGKDLTCFLRGAGITDDGGSETDIGTWCDPGATSRTAPKETFEAEFRQSFNDGTAGSKELFETLVGLADGKLKPIVWMPFGTPGPKFEFETLVSAPIGSFKVDQPTVVNVAWGISSKVFTPTATTP